MRVVLVAGTTRTAEIEGLSAAGSTPERIPHTPSADAELIEYGRPVRAPGMPVSPTGCPTPAAVTRAVRELVGFDFLAVDGGLDAPTGAPTVSVGAKPGRDVREADPVPTAPGAFVAARRFGRALPDADLVLGESVPVSSSLPHNPLDRKERIAREALAASDLEPGDAAHNPLLAARLVGDPVLAVVAGLVAGALGSGTRVTLGGGTQLLAAAALVRHAGVAEPLTLATTRYLADDVPEIREAALSFDLDLVVSDPGFDGRADALARYAAGEAKEGACMGGALALADREGVLGDVADETCAVVEAAGGDDGP